MAALATPVGTRPRLYHAPSSYYSMIARLALAEGGVAHDRVFMDIHLRLAQQRPAYVRLNPHMTVPTLVLPDRVLIESRDIATFALGTTEADLDAESRAWLDLHYALPIEELTFGLLLARNRMARIMVPKALGRAHRNLLAHAAQNPDLAPMYEARAKVFADRIRTFDPAASVRLAERRRVQAVEICERMERTLSDGRPTLVAGGYGVADTVLTAFLARIDFVGLGGEVSRRPALTRYWSAMQARPSFEAADVWTRFYLGRFIGGLVGIGRR